MVRVASTQMGIIWMWNNLMNSVFIPIFLSISRKNLSPGFHPTHTRKTRFFFSRDTHVASPSPVRAGLHYRPCGELFGYRPNSAGSRWHRWRRRHVSVERLWCCAAYLVRGLVGHSAFLVFLVRWWAAWVVWRELAVLGGCWVVGRVTNFTMTLGMCCFGFHLPDNSRGKWS